MSLLSRGARSLARALQTGFPTNGAGSRLHVLAYHLVGAGSSAAVDVPLEEFEAQLGIIREVAEPVALGDGLERLRQGGDGRPMVAVTFDDAFENFYTTAWPRLRAAAIPATLFVPVGFVEGDCPTPLRGAEGLPAASWSQLREMAADGLTLGSHSWSHCDMRRITGDPPRLERELGDSKSRIEDQASAPVRTFCYPRALWSRASEARVGTTYDQAVVAGGRAISERNLRPLRLWRLPVRRDGATSLAEALRGTLNIEEWLADKVRRRAW